MGTARQMPMFQSTHLLPLNYGSRWPADHRKTCTVSLGAVGRLPTSLDSLGSFL